MFCCLLVRQKDHESKRILQFYAVLATAAVVVARETKNQLYFSYPLDSPVLAHLGRNTALCSASELFVDI